MKRKKKADGRKNDGNNNCEGIYIAQHLFVIHLHFTLPVGGKNNIGIH